MRLFLVQHGEALSEAEDPDRPLSETGRANATTVADSLARSGVAVEAIYHSGKTRAEQTAQIFASRLAPGRMEALAGLAPKDDPAHVAQSLGELFDGAMLVGHLPHLDKLASLLVTGSPQGSVIGFRNAGVVALTEADGNWTVAWMVIPEVVGSANQ